MTENPTNIERASLQDVKYLPRKQRFTRLKSVKRKKRHKKNPISLILFFI